MKAVQSTVHTIADLIALGHEVVVTHGNGPQVGMIQQAFEVAARHEPKSPICPCRSVWP